jgi:beta-lactamase class A
MLRGMHVVLAVTLLLVMHVAPAGAAARQASGGPRPAMHEDAALTALAEAVRRAAAAAGAEIGVALRTLDGTRSLAIDADTVFHAASTMKVPVMIELFRQADAGLLSLDDELVVGETFTSIVDGSPYTLSAADDSDEALYAALGSRRSLKALCESMIVVSSNLATNLLIDRLGVDNVRATVARLGAVGVEVRRGVEDTKAFEAGRNNTTTAAGLLTLLTALAEGRAGSKAATAEMLAILARQQFNEGIPAGVPAGTRVAHKTGQITRIHHDAGIVYGPRPYVLVVLVRGVADAQESGRLIAAISRLVWDAVGTSGA